MASRDYRIASYCSSPSWGGLEMNVLWFLTWLQQRGWNAVLYARPDARLYTEAERNGLLVRPLSSRLRSGDLLNSHRLARQVRRDKVRRLIIHQSPDMFIGVFARLFAGNSVRLLFHQNMHIGGTKKDWYHSWLYGHIDAWVAPVSWLADRVKEKTTIAPERIHIIPHGIELDRFTRRRPEKMSARRRYNLPEDIFLIGMVGRLDPKKGQHVAVEALAQVHAAGHQAHLLLVGDQSFGEGDEYVAGLRTLIEKLNLGRFVHIHPHDDRIEYAYAALDVFVLASKSECYGMVTVEAMCSELPVIGTNDGGTVSLIDHGRNGLLVAPLDTNDLAEALLLLIRDNDFAVGLARQAGAEAIVRYSHTRQCEAWEDLFDRIDD